MTEGYCSTRRCWVHQDLFRLSSQHWSKLQCLLWTWGLRNTAGGESTHENRILQQTWKWYIASGFQGAPFIPKFGPNFHPTFEVFLTTNAEEVTLMVQDQDRKDVWRRNVYLRGKGFTNLQEQSTCQSLDPSDRLEKNRICKSIHNLAIIRNDQESY